MQKQEEKFRATGGKFQEYKIGNLFDIHPTKTYKMTNPKLFKNYGNTPVVTNSSIRNGITGYVNLNPTEKGGIITYSDTTTSEGIFFQPDDFIGYSHVQGLYPFDKQKWNEKSLLYFVVLFKKSAAGRFDYANKFNREIAKNMLVSLPTKNNQIDFDYMEERIRVLEEERIRVLESYLKVSGLTDCNLAKEEEKILHSIQHGNIKFKEFKLEDILNWQPQKEIDPLKIKELTVIGKNKYPFYGQATINNGIISYECLKSEVLNNTLSSPTILIHSNNQNCVYLETPFYLKDGHGATSVLQNKNLNELNAQFLISCIKKVIIARFSYDEKATKIALKNTYIQLPVSDNNQIDYAFMETYIRAIEKKVIKNVIDWKDAVIAKTKEVVKQ